MIENKVEFCKKYRIEINSEDCPVYNCIPQIIRCDNGSEYISKNFMNLVEELGITVSHVSPRTGSYDKR